MRMPRVRRMNLYRLNVLHWGPCRQTPLEFNHSERQRYMQPSFLIIDIHLMIYIITYYIVRKEFFSFRKIAGFQISFNLDFLVSSLQAQASTTSHPTSSEANVFAKVAHSAFNIPSQGFTVYVDEDSSKPTSLAGKRSSSFVSSEKLNLHPAVTALSRQPLTEVFLPPRVQSQLDGNS